MNNHKGSHLTCAHSVLSGYCYFTQLYQLDIPCRYYMVLLGCLPKFHLNPRPLDKYGPTSEG